MSWHHGHRGPLSALHGPLALTNEQCEKLYALRNDFLDQNIEKMVKLGKLRRQLMESLASANPDSKRSADIAAQITSAKADLERAKLDRLIASANVLTPEQRTAIHEQMIRHSVMSGMLGGHKGKMHGWGERG